MSEGERGFGVIEIVVSMLLLSLLAIAFLPLLIKSLQVSVANATTATASQLVSKHMEQARAAGDTCSAITAFVGSTLPEVTDSRGMRYQSTRTIVVPCPATLADYPGTVGIRVSVAIVGSSVSPVTATSLIYLKAP
ncbi:hypothetical protein E3T26_07340 [Cryobacterium sp. TMT1-21]|uniref:hypothetical protein n=1 Tax=Cryobacterium sp. TMT1-21 TaxID=1259234 RepID=UPI00106C6BE3|nr:hypothetical protein [Cryobacterium sp. TMT1-21]TFD15304.1 hypothetical protein E3T26_07340 [Cryobacterium sp. TMT1-21]